MSSLPSYRIRSVQEADIPLILDLVKKLADYEKMSDQVSASEELYRQNGFGNSSYFQALLVEKGEDAEKIYPGFALYFFTFSTFTGKPTLYLEDLFVLPEYRGLGIGKALLSRLAQIAVEKDCGRMEWSVLDWNQPAIQFYLRLGARPMDEWTVYRLDPPAFRRLAEIPHT